MIFIFFTYTLNGQTTAKTTSCLAYLSTIVETLQELVSMGFLHVFGKKKRLLHIYRVVGSGFCVFKTVCLNQMLLQPSSLYLLRLESTVLISILLRICVCVHARARVGVRACECCVCVKQKIIVSFDL